MGKSIQAPHITPYRTMDFSVVTTNTYILPLLVAAVVSITFLAVHYGLFYLAPARKKNQTYATTELKPMVSIILTAHNDAEWLRENLVYLLEQDYPNFEVVVVDYLSTDETTFVLQVCSDNYPNLKVVKITQDVNMFHSKKFPLSVGIKSASRESNIMLFIDADCVPQGFNWVSSMVKGYTNSEKQIVLGYCGLKQEPTLLNAMQQYENLTNNLSMLSAAIHSHPYTGCGRNLSYHRDFFYEQGAFTSHYTESEGADDMFVNQNAKGKNTSIVIDPESYVIAKAQESHLQWMQQRRSRQASRRHYSIGLKMQHALHPLATVLFYASLIALVAMGFPWEIALGVFVLKTAWQIFTLSKTSKKFECDKIFWYAPLFEIYFLFANTFLHFIPLHNRK